MKTFTLNFNEQQLQVLSAALVEWRFNTSAPILPRINAEIKKQFDKAVDEKNSDS